jgi:hypothetical protein
VQYGKQDPSLFAVPADYTHRALGAPAGAPK